MGARNMTAEPLYQYTLEAPTRWRVVTPRGAIYFVDSSAKTCSCPGFQFRRRCKHLAEVLSREGSKQEGDKPT
jgi:hypothetical protein